MTRDEILQAARTARAELVGLIQSIEEQIDVIKDKEWERELTKADRDKLAALRARKSEVMIAVEELGYVTMGALDRTDEVRRIANAITGVRKDLNAKRQEFATFARGVTDFGNVLKKLKAIADELTKRFSAS